MALREVRIKNFAIIDRAEIFFEPGFNVMTGETGAGKSIVINSLNASLGERASSELIRSGSETAEVEAFFDRISPEVKARLREAGIEDADELIIKRELSRNGKGRCYINNSMVTVGTLKNISEYLADIHGQHEHQALLNTRNQLELLDTFGKLGPERERYGQCYRELCLLEEKRASLVMSEQEKQRRLEMLQYAIKEIENAELKPGEEEELDRLRNILVNSEKVAEHVNKIYALINGDENTISALAALEDTRKILEQLALIDPSLVKTLEAVKNIVLELRDEAETISSYREKMDFDPKRLESVEDRRDILLKLKKKYGATVREILDFYEKQKAELQAMIQKEGEIEKVEAELNKLKAQTCKKAEALSGKRKEAARGLEKRVIAGLADLGMAKTVFKTEFCREENENGLFEQDGKKYVLTGQGLDRVQFLISSNTGEEPKPLSKIASGGEMSRIMLTLKVIIGQEDKVGTLVFDEIDTGIGGNMGNVAGEKMAEAGRTRQVICITHLPQIAAQAGCHIYIEKSEKNGKTVININKLDKEKRIKEFARMLGGADNKAAVAHAKELLKENS